MAAASEPEHVADALGGIEPNVVVGAVPHVAGAGKQILHLERLLSLEAELAERHVERRVVGAVRVEVHDHDQLDCCAVTTIGEHVLDSRSTKAQIVEPCSAGFSRRSGSSARCPP